MGSIVLYMSMSLDGFITGPDDGPGQGLGLNGSRLFRWLDERNTPGPNKHVVDEALATGAVIAGRRTYENADHWQGDHHDGVPIFVLTHHPPARSRRPTSPICTTASSGRHHAALRSRVASIHPCRRTILGFSRWSQRGLGSGCAERPSEVPGAQGAL
jgi:dihydrofolate reductase